MSYELTYENLGRGKATGKAIVKELTYKELNRVFKPFYGSTLSFQIEEEQGEGMILFGWYIQYFKIREVVDE